MMRICIVKIASNSVLIGGVAMEGYAACWDLIGPRLVFNESSGCRGIDVL
jgi:hypothetical protein